MTTQTQTADAVDLAALAATLGVTPADLQALQAKNKLAGIRTTLAKPLKGVVQQVLEVQPCKPSSKETSSWVGSILGAIEVTVDGRAYTVQVTVKDEAASAARKAQIG